MKLQQQSASDKNGPSLERFMEGLTVFTQGFRSKDGGGLRSLETFIQNGMKTMDDLMPKLSMLTAETVWELEYDLRMKTCRAYLSILEWNAKLAHEGVPFNLLDCVVTAAAFNAQIQGMACTVRLNEQIERRHQLQEQQKEAPAAPA